MKSLTLFLLLLIVMPSVAQTKPKRTVPAKSNALRSLNTIAAQSDFDKLARIYYQGRFYALPHLMFVIDRANKNKVYYVNSKLYSFHKDFVNANYLSLERGNEFFRHNYLEAERRFVLGTVAFQTKPGKFSFELWEGDQATAEIISDAYKNLSASFFAPIAYKPNSKAQEKIAEKLAKQAIPILNSNDIGAARDYVPLHQARAVGMLRVVDKLTDDIIIDRNEIIIFKESPITLTPLSGVITSSFSTPLSHVNLLAAGWGIPNASIKNADETFKALVGKFVYFETREDGFVLRAADLKETAEAGKILAKRSDLLTPVVDLEFKNLSEIKEQRAKNVSRFGAKAANLGELFAPQNKLYLRGFTIPPGFSIPFFYYQQFLEETKLDQAIVSMLGNDRFNHDPAYRKQRLAEMRQAIQNAKLSASFQNLLHAKAKKLFGDLTKIGVFARSSTNSEDLPNFSGAGLYTSVPNIKSDVALDEGVKTVWASLWNFEAYEARESAGINHSGVYPSVLVQEGINADSAGVMITTNPFDKTDKNAIYINAKRGLGIRVVEGKKVAEQLIFNPLKKTTKVLTRSGDDTMLKFDENGGVKEIKIETERAVLSDDLVRRLAQAAMQIKKAFGGRDQDIEWLTVGKQIYIVQSRPYVRR